MNHSYTRHLNYYESVFTFFFFFSPSIRMSEKNIIFNNEKINKSNLYKNEKLFNIDYLRLS